MGAARFSVSNGDSGLTALITVVVVIVVAVLAWNHLVVPAWEKYIVKYDQPWWSGNEAQRVCTTTVERRCYSLVVASTGEEIETIYFPNGGYVDAYDWECMKAGSYYGFDRFCRVWDAEGQLYDVIPQ